ncbi:chloride channel protein [Hoeflea prorocentri]|uniref:Chloride channel protein n=1 Tax=Hoeflea prorocentri TaxID=1922333 RepID=A0A9X3UFW3_9HYPH|nr:chloride channel protein [Hoeflea prorocentri]MCY6379961.1 chloride channel protein [Hoeflea prorocentri]MDA5397761.1 chloride channel protein [Hoeflea prorocentri]
MLPDFIRNLPTQIRQWVAPNIRNFTGERQPRLWLMSLVIGVGVTIAAILFREMIGAVQLLWLQDRSERVISATRSTPWYLIFLAPVAGGLVVGILLQVLMPQRRTLSVADVIEARALTGRKLGLRDGLNSAIITVISLGSGASAGREGPVIHLGATLANHVARRTDLPEWSKRTLLGAGVAAAISASFNAPVAGVLFAHEVILGHFALRSFVPIVIASSGAAIISRGWFGESAAFVVPQYHVASYWEFPGFALLGLVAAIVAIAFQFSLFSADFVARKITMPLWLRPVLGGIAIGGMGVFLPHILGVGYEATDLALWGRLPLYLMLILIVAKTLATAITLASRFGGGVFSPALYLGAMTGGAYGIIAANVFPDLASSPALYSILGMGAVAGAVLGAPISTTLIVFELTGGYELSIALLLTVAIAHGINQAIHGHSYFQWQLEMRGIFVQAGPHRAVGSNVRVMDFMTALAADEPEQTFDTERGVPSLRPTDTLDTALRTFDSGGHARLPVVDEVSGTTIIGWADQVQALAYFNKRLIDASEEEHR